MIALRRETLDSALIEELERPLRQRNCSQNVPVQWGGYFSVPR
jgi:hypothetical protein